MVAVVTIVAFAVGILVMVTVVTMTAITGAVFAVVVFVLTVAAMHDGHTVVAIDRPAVAVVTADDAFGVDGAATGGVTAAIGVTGATVAMAGFGFVGEGNEAQYGYKGSDYCFHGLISVFGVRLL